MALHLCHITQEILLFDNLGCDVPSGMACSQKDHWCDTLVKTSLFHVVLTGSVIMEEGAREWGPGDTPSSGSHNCLCVLKRICRRKLAFSSAKADVRFLHHKTRCSVVLCPASGCSLSVKSPTGSQDSADSGIEVPLVLFDSD